MSNLTCPRCANDSNWRSARQRADGTQEAICGRCGEKVKASGGVQMGTVIGGMTQER